MFSPLRYENDLILENMETKHYKIINIDNFLHRKNETENLEKYLESIEKIFTYIEEVFGKEWDDDLIKVELTDKTCYARPNGVHLIKIKLHDGIIQRKKYPENLWGCLFHETLHAFMNPVVHKRTGESYNLNGGCAKEPFVKSFQAMVYLKLKEKGELSNKLYNEFYSDLSRLEDDSKKVFDYYINFFTKKSNYFAQFIEKLNVSKIILITRDNFWQNLDTIKNSLN